MIESIHVFFAGGFLVAGLLGLATDFLGSPSRRPPDPNAACKISLPVSLTEIQADRDKLRAKFRHVRLAGLEDDRKSNSRLRSRTSAARSRRKVGGDRQAQGPARRGKDAPHRRAWRQA